MGTICYDKYNRQRVESLERVNLGNEISPNLIAELA